LRARAGRDHHAAVTLALLHGFGHPPASWAEVRAALRAPAIDCPLPGHDPRWPVADGWAATLAALAARVPADAIAVGYSLGARLALGLLAADRVRAAILIGVNPGLADPAERAARVAADAAWAARLRADGTAAFLDAWEAQPIFATAARAPAAVRDRRRAARAALDPAALADAMTALGLGAMPDLADALVARAARARLIVGADDAKFTAIAAALAARAPALGPTIIADSGHDPTLEQPAALAAAIDALAAALG
jgi:2-succinyl-6-hydroxy-2,4-cyclohexadiene-1-carboxylate synthase